MDRESTGAGVKEIKLLRTEIRIPESDSGVDISTAYNSFQVFFIFCIVTQKTAIKDYF